MISLDNSARGLRVGAADAIIARAEVADGVLASAPTRGVGIRVFEKGVDSKIASMVFFTYRLVGYVGPSALRVNLWLELFPVPKFCSKA